jgi:hypothetical protein
MAWMDISGFHVGLYYGRKQGFVKLTLSDGTTEFIDNLEYDAFNPLLDLLRHDAKFFEKDLKIVSQIQELPPKKIQPPVRAIYGKLDENGEEIEVIE